jgi:hypothetical protein
MQVFRDWKREDTMLTAVLDSALVIARKFTSIILLDPYYGPCQYSYVGSQTGQC